MKTIPNYPHCFVCGDKNKEGLNIAFFFDKGKAKAQYTSSKKFEGYPDILHGGIISALLDEVMIQSIVAAGIPTFTVQIDVKFKKPAKIGEKLLLEGWITKDKGRIFLTEGKISREDGTLIASANGKYYKVQDKMKEHLKKR